MKRTTRTAAAVATVLLAAAPSAWANRVGVVGKATAGCGGTGCHEGGVAPTAVIEGPGTVAPGETIELTLTVSGGQETAAGANIAVVGGGALQPAEDEVLRTFGVELTHNGGPLAYEDGKAVFRFLFEAPATEGTVTINAAANSVNDDRLQTGDLWATASTQITVAAEGGEGGAGGADPPVGGAGGAGGAGGPDAGAGGGGDDDGGGGGGCHAGPPGHDSPLLAFLLVGFLMLRRRKSEK